MVTRYFNWNSLGRTDDYAVELQPELEGILRNAVRALGGSAAVVATWDDAVRRFVVTGAYGLDGPQIARIRPLLNEAIPDLALSREQFALLSALFPQTALPISTTGEMQNPVMAVPLYTSDETVGLDMGVNNRMALSTGEMVERREFDRTREAALRRKVSRCR